MLEIYNWLILLAAMLLTAGLLFVASHAEWWVIISAGIAFAFLNNTSFSMMHEAVHGIASKSKTRNDLIGTLAGFTFPTSYSLQKIAHMGHHKRNRMDADLYDYYLPQQSRWLRNLWLYLGNLMGFYWLCIPLSNLVFLVLPGIYKSSFFVNRIAPLLGFESYIQDIAAESCIKIWLELLFAILYQVLLWNILDLNLLGWITCYGLFALHWSALQYVNHAWSARDIINGAWNLQVSRIGSLLALNYHYHLAHHQNPCEPWTKLPSLVEPDVIRPSFWQIYCSLWRGVRPAPPMGAPANTTLF